MEIRQARSQDAAPITALLAELGYPLTPLQVREKLLAMADVALDTVLVAGTTEPVNGESILLGCISLHALPMFHQPGRLGRITALVVTEQARGRGVGSALLDAAHAWFESHGCDRAEVTSGDQRHAAHRFYESHGYARESQRFVRKAARSI